MDPLASEEALRTLERLRAGLLEQEESHPGILKAIESLIEEYEQQRS